MEKIKNMSPDSKNKFRNLESGLGKAFTLVELIVVITILAILGTIAFISLQGYSRDARDSTRTADLGNMKTSLELYSLKTGNYPKPDNFSTITYSGGTENVWYQGIVGDQVTTNLKSLNEKPLDPLTKSPYTYSVTQSFGEYEVLALYEGSVAYQVPSPERGGLGRGLFPQANAAVATLTPKVVGNYNGVFVKTTNYIIPTPSIIIAEPLLVGIPLLLTSSSIKSLVITNGKNIPKNNLLQAQTGALTGFKLKAFTGTITKNSPKAKKVEAITQIQNAYTGAISLNTKQNIAYILNQTSTGQIVALTDITLLKGHSTLTSNTSTNTTPTPPPDTTPPVLSSITQIFTTTLGTTLTLATVTANDAVDGVIIPVQGGVIPNFNVLGTYAVIYTATDAAGNASTITHTYVVNVVPPTTIADCTAQNTPIPFSAITTRPLCDTADIIVCSGVGVGYTISACNEGTNIAGLTPASDGGTFQFGRNTAYPIWTNGVAGNNYDWKGVVLWGSINSGSANDWGVSEANKTTATYTNSTSTNQIKMQGPCVIGYHVPTNAEWVGIYTSGQWGSGGPMSIALKLPNARQRNFNGVLTYRNVWSYWSSSPDTINGYSMHFSSNYMGSSDYFYRGYGFSVRCFKN